MSIFTYNGVTLPYCHATDFRQEAVFDETNTDRIYTKFDITVQTLINAEYVNLLAASLFSNGNPATRNPAEIMKVVRAKLLQPRRALSYKFNGIELIPAKQAITPGTTQTVPGTVDAKNGPLPQSCQVIDLTNTTFLMTFHIIAHYWENLVVDLNRDPITRNDTGGNALYNRWTETVEIDDCQYSTRTREGKFIIRSDNAGNVLADQLRSQLAVVSVPEGFLRESSSYTVTPDGLAIQYRIVDKEVYKMPPQPAYKASARYLESSVMFGNVRFGEVRVRLKGRKDTSRAFLLDACIQFCLQKLRARQGQLSLSGSQKIPRLESAVVDQDLFENEISMNVKVMYRTDNKRKRGIAGFAEMDLSTPLSSPSIRPAYFDRGTASLLLQAAKYYDPSLTNTQLGTGNPITDDVQQTSIGGQRYQHNNGVEPGRAGRELED